MGKILLFSVFLLNIFFISSFENIPKNYFKIGNKQWKLDSAEIVNESYDNKSKFELDLISGGNEISNAQTFVWLSLTSSTTYDLANGIYNINKQSLSDREPYSFNGSVFINDKEIKIIAGTFSVENLNNSIEVNMIFQLANGDILNGSYTGKFSSCDRSSTYK